MISLATTSLNKRFDSLKMRLNSRYNSAVYFMAVSVLIFILKCKHDLPLNTTIDGNSGSNFQQASGNTKNIDQANGLPSHLPSSATQHGNNHKVSYVTSFWAKTKSKESNPHRREVEAALLANIHNPHLDEIVVFLDREDGADAESCVDFRRAMSELSRQVLGMTAEASNHLLENKLKCVDVQTGQPTYYQMFQNALSEVVTGDIVVLSNGDIAFDDTMSLARRLNPEVLVVLSMHGFSDKLPLNIKHIYEEMMGKDYITNVEQRSDHPGNWDINRCAEKFSWDTYIFHKSKLLGRLKEEDFKRLNVQNERIYFYMNENGAENAALWAIENSYPFSSTYQACDRIHSWHFHLTPKTHKVREIAWRGIQDKKSPMFTPRGSVPKPWGDLWETPVLTHMHERTLIVFVQIAASCNKYSDLMIIGLWCRRF